MTTAITSGAPAAVSRAGSTGSSSTLNGAPLCAASASGASTDFSGPARTWTAHASAPVNWPIRRPSPSLAGGQQWCRARQGRCSSSALLGRGRLQGERGGTGLARRRRPIGDPREKRCLAGNGDPFVLGSNANGLPAEAKLEAESKPCVREAGVDGEHAPLCPQAQEAACECLPYPSHGRQVESFRGCSSQIVKVEAAGQAEELDRPLRLTGTRKQRRVDRGGERAAMSCPGPIEGQARLE